MRIETEDQWKVTWFPPDVKERTITGNEARVKKTADLQRDWNPIIERRTITVGDWEIVTDDGG